MSTHMWTNTMSARGHHRKPIEIGNNQASIPINLQKFDFSKHRPDLYYPYISPAFLNGIQQKTTQFFGNHIFSNEP